MTTTKNSERFGKFKRYLPQLPFDILKLFVILLFLFPFYWMFITSFKTYNESIQMPPTLWPQTFTLESYRSIFQKMNLLNYAKNSVIVTISIIAIQMVVMVPAAYAFAKFNFKGRGILFSMVLIAFMIPGQVTFITTYLTMAEWGLINTLWPQILPFGANAFGIFLLRQTFMQIPDEILESAQLDNASELQIMTQILLPMSMSTLVTIGMFSFVDHWNAYFWPLVMTQTESVRPLTIAIEKMKDMEYGINWNTIMAGNVILVLPILIVFIFASKKIIQAFAYRGMK